MCLFFEKPDKPSSVAPVSSRGRPFPSLLQINQPTDPPANQLFNQPQPWPNVLHMVFHSVPMYLRSLIKHFIQILIDSCMYFRSPTGYWSNNDHFVFLYVVEQYTHDISGRRHLYIDRLKRHIPHLTRAQIVGIRGAIRLINDHTLWSGILFKYVALLYTMLSNLWQSLSEGEVYFEIGFGVHCTRWWNLSLLELKKLVLFTMDYKFMNFIVKGWFHEKRHK